MLWLTVDQIDGESAQLIGDEEQITLTLPVSALPAGAQEGSILKLTLQLDEEEGRRARQMLTAQLNELMGDDDGGDFEL